VSRGQIRVPHVYTIIFCLTVLVALASLVVPAGSFDRNADDQIVPGTFELDRDSATAGADPPPRGLPLLFAVLQAPLKGIVDAGNIIAFLLVIGGAFKVIEASGAFTAAIRYAVDALGGRGYLVIPVSMLMFSAGGAVFGMSEEVIPFVMLFVPLMQALGYPPLIGVAVPLIGAGMGFAGAMLNPFTVGVAQAIAELPPISGWPVRTLAWVVLTAIGIGYVSWQASRLRGGPEAAALAPDSSAGPDENRLERRHLMILLTLAAGIGVMIWGIGEYKWYVIEIGAIFLAIGLVSGLFARLSATGIAQTFLGGAKDLLSAAIVVGIARGIVLLAEEVRLLDPALYGVSSTLEHAHGVVSINLMFLFQSLLNFFVPSGSGQAALTMPIMAPLADLIGLTRQMAVLAFQFGDGFSNLIIPTSAVLMGSLETGKVSYERWFRFAWPLQVLLLATGMIILSLAFLLGFGA
jgi:uncharacterized ion transporter superfamily protein YfcC